MRDSIVKFNLRDLCTRVIADTPRLEMVDEWKICVDNWFHRVDNNNCVVCKSAYCLYEVTYE